MKVPSVRIVIACAMGAWLTLAGAAIAGESKGEDGGEPLKLESLPEAVRQTATEQSKGATILEITSEVDQGETVYELAMKVKGRTRDIIIGADGTLLVEEDAVLMTELPAAVRQTFEKNVGKGKIVKLESVKTRGTFAYYEAQVRIGKKLSEIRVGADGALVPAEAK